MTQAEKIKAQRIKAGYSQETLAEAMDISRQAVTNWEAGQSAPSSANLRKLASLLEVEVSALMADAPHTPESLCKPKWTLGCMIGGAVIAAIGGFVQLIIWLISTTHVVNQYIDEIGSDGMVHTFMETYSSYEGYIRTYHLETIVMFMWSMVAVGVLLLIFGACFRFRKNEPLI